jgi:hypothetical protein
MEIHLDSSAVNRLAAQGLLAASGGIDGTVFVSLTALEEILAFQEAEGLRRRARFLLGLKDLRFTPSIPSIWIAETFFPIRKTPRADGALERGIRDLLTEVFTATDPVAAVGAAFRSDLASWKADQRVRDATSIEHLQRGFRTRGIHAGRLGAQLEAILSPGTIPEWLPQRVAAVHISPYESILRSITDLVRHRALHAWCALAYLTMVGQGVDPSHRSQHAFLRHLAPGDNDFVDANIAATAAYGDLLLSNDSPLRDRMNFLRSRGFLLSEAAPPERFLRGQGNDTAPATAPASS